MYLKMMQCAQSDVVGVARTIDNYSIIYANPKCHDNTQTVLVAIYGQTVLPYS